MSKKPKCIVFDNGCVINDLLIESTFIENYYRKYNYTCLKCGYKGNVMHGNLKKGRGCPCCSNRVTVEHINSIVANEETHWMVDYFPGGWNEAKLYTFRSNKRLVFKCPHCGRLKDKDMQISKLYEKHSIGCFCGDKISYPEKVMSNILDQLSLKYIRQFGIDSYRYDFLVSINNINHIIETHGSQHYRDAWESHHKTLENDKRKAKRAYDYGFVANETYHVVNCRESNIRWIKESVMSSNLNNILGITDDNVDWQKANEFGTSNMTKIVCKYKADNDSCTTGDIARIFKINQSTATEYLKRGNELGWCSYDVEIERQRATQKNTQRVIEQRVKFELYENDKLIRLCDGITDTSNVSLKDFGVHFSRKTIRHCIDTGEKYKGYTFKEVS